MTSPGTLVRVDCCSSWEYGSGTQFKDFIARVCVVGPRFFAIERSRVVPVTEDDEALDLKKCSESCAETKECKVP